ncbi:GPP34 family phosphoprotein [Embleya sp. NBC_00896]|uniref:GOLPH3/VPS74 family protein n=1 Tax=Embleya sp. NBC_00896 TaxID=2975961 RepID=UPI00386C55D5|nr:GPP34 family phosphoprotein [Embleya sp. NBC_00896]
MNVSLAQRVFLLAYSPEKRRLLSRRHLGSTLQAAAMQDLREQGLIADDDGKVRATAARGATPGCDLAAALLTRIVASDRARPWRHWIKKGDRGATGLVGDQLKRERVIRFESHRFLGIVPGHRMLLRQPQLRGAATQAMWDTLKPVRPVARISSRDAALTAMAYEGELRVVLGGRERRAAKGRVRELEAGLGPVPDALRRVVRDRNST